MIQLTVLKDIGVLRLLSLIMVKYEVLIWLKIVYEFFDQTPDVENENFLEKYSI